MTLLGIVIALVLALVFFVPLNNVIRNATGHDTPTDALVKDEIIKKVRTEKTGNKDQDKRADEYVSRLKGTKMSAIMKAATDEEKAAVMIHNSSNLSMKASQKAAEELFNNTKYNQLRKSVSKGDWLQTYQQYKKLSNDGSLTQLRQKAAEQ